ncbi:Hsp70 family protein [Nocardia wallacei]|uniref:Hsp70 family protein n=1 Tax=Nocardia wallacei TaxID=480035 RepID=UPI002456409F|nr:Hsp70 family protein [Nocardia wallacei]
MSIGTVNSVWAAAGDRDQPAVRVRRTAVTFDSAGGARMGTLPRFAPVVTDFADLTRYTEPVVLNGRIWTQADLVAAVIACLLAVDEPAAGPVATYPAVYSDRRLSPLRHALERAGATDVTLMPEAVAAVEWLDAEYGVSENGLTLVYDLGGNTLDVAVVRTEGDRDKRGVLGKPMRSHEYGGRPLGTVLARYARALAPGAPPPVSKVVPLDDTTRLRTWTVRNSLRLVRKCVYAAGLTVGDIDRVLLVGGAARPPEVARVLSELGRPLVISQDPAHTVAIGAALAAARMADPGVHLGRYARGAAVISSAAVASAVAMSAASMLGSGPLGTDGPALEFAPALAGPARNQFGDIRAFEGAGVTWSAGVDGNGSALPGGFGSGLQSGFGSALSAGADGLLSTTAALRLKGAAAQSMSTASSAATTRSAHSRGPSTHCGPADRPMGTTYADPARFTNPLPFAAPTIGPVSSTIPSISLPTKPTAPSPNPDTTHLPGSSPSNPSASSPGTNSGTPISDNPGNSTTPGAGLPNNPTGITGGAVPGGAGTNIPGQGSPNTNPAPPGNGTGQGTPGGSAGTEQGGVGAGAGSGGVGGTGPGGVGSDVGSGGIGGTGADGVGSGAGSGGVGGTNPGDVGSGGVGTGGVGGDAGSGGTGDGSVAGGVDGGAGQGGVGAGTGQGGGTGAGSGGSTDGAQGDSSQRSGAASGGGTQGSGTSSGGGTSSGNSSSGGGPSNSGTAGGHSSNPGTASGGSTSTGHSSTGGVPGRTSNGSKSNSKPDGPTSRGSSGGSHSSSGGGGFRR